MKTITIEIINDKVLKVLKALEDLKMIRLRKGKETFDPSKTSWGKYKGAMSKQPMNDVNAQIDALRNEWD